MDATERKRIRDLNALRFSNLQNITLKKVVEAKTAYKQALANLQAQKQNYTPEYIAEQTKKIESDYSAKLAGVHQELLPTIDELQASIEQMQSTLDLSDPGLTNALKLIELGGKNLGSETINKINQSFQHNQPALKALQAVYKSGGVTYDGGIDNMVYSIDSTFNALRESARATFQDRNASINSFASKVAKVAKFEGYQFEANPDPYGFGEAVNRGAGLPAE